jgi:hypothetical protein
LSEDRLADAIQRFLEEPDPLEHLIELAKGAAPKAREIMRKHDLSIDDLDDPMQKLAFTFYTDLCEVGDAAEAVEEALGWTTPNADYESREGK